MNQKECYDLIGLPATDPKVLEYFAKYELGKVPKTANTSCAVMGKTIEDKERNIIFSFKWDLTNDRFYPPVSPKKDNYNFNLFLSKISIGRNYPRKRFYFNDPDFYDVTHSLDTSYDALVKLYGEPDKRYNVVFSKNLTSDFRLRVFYDPKIDSCIEITYEIITCAHFLNHYDFNQNEQSYVQDEALSCMLVKWLYDNHYLKIDDKYYQTKVLNTKESVRNLVNQALRGHLWDNQITAEPLLRNFLFYVGSARTLKNENGEEVSFYNKPLILRQFGLFEEWDALGNTEKQNQVLLKIVMNEESYAAYYKTMNENFELFKQLKPLAINADF